MLYQTCAHIHLGNIKKNIESIRKLVGNQRKISIAVKANAYGHGAVEVARTAEDAGADWLGVATVPEGMELRKAGITLPILKLSPIFPEEIKAALENGMTLSCCDEYSVGAIQKNAEEMGITAAVHLNIETGMGRAGASIDEAPDLAAYIENDCGSLELEGLFTHLPVSDEDATIFTENQIENFKKSVAAIVERIGRRPDLVHCSNSGGILGYPEGWLDMVRPGIMIYGIYSGRITAEKMDLFPGMSLTTRVAYIKKVKKGTTIGYGRTWEAAADAFIATIPVGYADGYSRLFSNCGRVLINGQSYSIAGRICMDQCMIDLGPRTDVSIGDTVVLMGQSGKRQISCLEWAEKMNTITYEVTCNISSRVERLYL